MKLAWLDAQCRDAWQRYLEAANETDRIIYNLFVDTQNKESNIKP